MNPNLLCVSALVAMAVLWAVPRSATAADPASPPPRERVSFNDDWRFIKGEQADVTPKLTLLQVNNGGGRRGGGAGRGGTPANDALWQYILPTSNDFIKDPAKHVLRPTGNPAEGIAYAAADFDDKSWRQLDLPHDFGIEGPFIAAGQRGSDGGTGRLPFFGQAWYRKELNVSADDLVRQVSLDIDGAMAYAIVFVNGQVAGGWPYGYASWRCNLTPYLKAGNNSIAIRLDNPPNSSRWYPGGGIYRNVWLVKTSPIHVAHWGTYITTPEVSAASGTVNLKVSVDNDSKQDANLSVSTAIVPLDANGQRPTDGPPAAVIPAANLAVAAGASASVEGKVAITNPKLWSPDSPNRYVAITTVRQGNNVVDQYETPFGIRTVQYDPNQGLSINGVHYKMNGVCDHHDLGALGTAVNYRALQRQLQILRDMGCNAIRTSHNPPTPELLDMADQMGFMVMDETFDTWRGTKTPNDYGRIFDAWHEQDTRTLVRRDRNHPSVIMWSVGNEVGEQGQGDRGAAVARELCEIVHQEDPTRPTAAAENSATPGSPFSAAIDTVGMNYQGSRPGRGSPNGNYPNFHRDFPDKFIFGSETASTISSRGEYSFPVAPGYGSIVNGNTGELGNIHQMSSYDLYYPSWATSPDTEFAAQDRFPYVGGEFVWTGFDYIGEPTPWGGNNDPSRSSYFGIIDLAGFPKDRYYLYQAHWRPDLPMAHLLPHWNWPDRVGQVTPVHVYTSGDEAELFVNGVSQGRKKKEPFQYRIRWDDVVYQPGEIHVIAYKNGKEWATDSIKTTGASARLALAPDRAAITADGHDLSFIKLTVQDAAGLMVPTAKDQIHFSISGPGEIVATDNGDPTDQVIFASKDRKAFNGLALCIVKAKRGESGPITVTATADGLTATTTVINGK